MSIIEYDNTLGIIHELLPPDSKLPNDFYQFRKLLEGLSMPYIKIVVCYNNIAFYSTKITRTQMDAIFVVLTNLCKGEQRSHMKFFAIFQ